jgi:hypothetical protein
MNTTKNTWPSGKKYYPSTQKKKKKTKKKFDMTDHEFRGGKD